MTLVLNEPSNLTTFDDGAAGAGSLLGALVIVARHRDIHLSKDQIVRDYQLRGTDVSVAELLRRIGSPSRASYSPSDMERKPLRTLRLSAEFWMQAFPSAREPMLHA